MAQPPTLKTNLIACWNFDGDSTDDLGNHDGSEVGSPSYPASGNLFDQCLYLPGDGSYVDAGDITTDIFDGSNDVVTFAAWVKLDSDKTYNNLYVFEKEDAFEIRIYVGRIYVYIFDSVTWSEVRTAYYTVDYDTWVHLVVAVDLGSDDLKIYVNGTECSNFWDNCTNVIVDNSNVCKMGISSWDFFDGYIQQALLYNRCFTQSDVDELYNSGDGIKYPFFFPKIFSTFHGVGEFNEAQAIRNDCSDYGTIGYAETLGLSTQLLFNFNPALGSGDINSFSGVLGTIASFQNFSTGLGTGILENLISFSIGDCDHQFNPVGMGLIEQQLNK
ncbi:MAG: LamG domain-containing protein, partial [Patescibacteria group bacterium]|nr:LamG domain-containing protein [Patescibacteria group bacterium]